MSMEEKGIVLLSKVLSQGYLTDKNIYVSVGPTFRNQRIVVLVGSEDYHTLT